MMLKLRNPYTEDELALLLVAMTPDEPVDVDTVLDTLNRLFDKEEYDGEDEYVIITADAVPEKPGPERDRMWEWIEQTENHLGVSIEVWGRSGEYLTPSTICERVYRLDDFWEAEDGTRYIERALADSLIKLVEFHRAWRMFASSTTRSKRNRSEKIEA